MKVFFAGHNSFGNRGCEALVRSVSGLITRADPSASFLVPSLRPDLDARQWPEHAAHGVTLVPAQGAPKKLRYWHWARRLVPMVEQLGRPSHRLQPQVAASMEASDVVVMTGGDTISLDYDLPSLYDHAGYIDNARRMGKRTVLWAASVGPFTRKPHVERLMHAHLASYDQITVRESATFQYLKQLGIADVVQVTDPAFTLQPEAFDTSAWASVSGQGLLGLNVSPLIRKFRESEASRVKLDEEIAAFVRVASEEKGYTVLLIPHVGPLDGTTYNADHAYMAGLLDRYRLALPRVRLAPANLNAAQLKHLIAGCRLFIGARTHATIAAFSTGVPTLSIAYSVKAKGINRDLFGDLPVVLDTPDVDRQTLLEGLERLERHEAELRALLVQRMPEWRLRAGVPATMLARLMSA